jgi:3',5'-cyclic AMP phosphodiesterase CpdA
VNTARALVIKGGSISREQREMLEQKLAALPKEVVRIVVAHHPFDLPDGLSGVAIVKHAHAAMELFARYKVDLFLGGHLHLAFIGHAARYRIDGYDAPINQAGTATSTRARGEPNSFSVIRIDSPKIAIDTWTWFAGRQVFELSGSHEFSRIS